MTNKNETIERRIKALEVTKEGIDAEIRTTDVLIQKLETIKEEISPTREVTKEVKTFINRLKNEKQIQEIQRDEIVESIEFVRNEGNKIFDNLKTGEKE